MVEENAKCPFYGFMTMMNSLTDQQGNQCALVTDRYSPCEMEMEKETPCWDKCGYNLQNEGFVDKLEELDFTVSIKGRSEDVPIRTWYNHVMHGKSLPRDGSRESRGESEEHERLHSKVITFFRDYWNALTD